MHTTTNKFHNEANVNEQSKQLSTVKEQVREQQCCKLHIQYAAKLNLITANKKQNA